jgi:hypothetical protein
LITTLGRTFFTAFFTCVFNIAALLNPAVFRQAPTDPLTCANSLPQLLGGAGRSRAHIRRLSFDQARWFPAHSCLDAADAPFGHRYCRLQQEFTHELRR